MPCCSVCGTCLQVSWEFWTNSNDECGLTCDKQKKFVKVHGHKGSSCRRITCGSSIATQGAVLADRSHPTSKTAELLAQQLHTPCINCELSANRCHVLRCAACRTSSPLQRRWSQQGSSPFSRTTCCGCASTVLSQMSARRSAYGRARTAAQTPMTTSLRATLGQRCCW